MPTVTLEQSNAYRLWIARWMKERGYEKNRGGSLADIVAYVEEKTGYKPSRSTVKRIVEELKAK